MRFPNDMYISPVGSYVISCFILSNGSEAMARRLTSRWKRAIRKNKELDPFDLKTIADYFGVPYTTAPIAMVQSQYNVVYLPYIKGQLYPIREDGLITNTMITGKIYPLE